MLPIVGYSILLLLLFFYSFALMDPNITFFNNSLWTAFREKVIYFGYYQRETSSLVYIFIIIALFAFHYFFIRKLKKFDPLKISFLIGSFALISYPFLSHDFFNYLFDAKILTFYHQNPYLHKALDFPHDPWTRFMHWTHRTYPYGPVFLGLSAIPSFLGFGKFILSFLFFKLLFIGLYIVSVFTLKRFDKRKAMILATHPLVIIEGLVVAHNDIVGLALAIIGSMYLIKGEAITGKIWMIVSAGIKYITLPLILVSPKKKVFNIAALVGVVVILIYFTFKQEIQPWYFLVIFGLLPIYKDIIDDVWIFLLGLLLSYYPYIRFGGWDHQFEVDMKHWIIGVFFVLNIIYLFLKRSKIKFFTK